MTETENRLNEDCNLIVSGTHEIYVRPEDQVVFVADKELNYPFGVTNALTQAQDTAQESHDDPKGCITCPLFDVCQPQPSALRKSGQNILIPAQKTAFPA